MKRIAIALVMLCVGAGTVFAAGLVDPTTNPAGAIDQVVAFAHQNFWLGIAAAAYGALELLAALGKEGGKLAALGKGRVSIVIAGGLVVLGAGLNSFVGGAQLMPALIAAVVAFAAYWHPAAKDVAAAKGFIRRDLLVMLLVPALFFALYACATFKAMSGKFATCEKADLGATVTVDGVVSDAEQAVATALASSGLAGVPAALAGVAVAIGGTAATDTIDCAISAIESAIPAAKSGSSGAAAMIVAYAIAPDKIAAGRAWVAQRRAAGK